MSYCIINKIPVFLYSSRIKEIQGRALKGRNAMREIDSIVARTKESREVDAFTYEFLSRQYEQDPVNFRINWAAFDITGEEAAREVWDLLHDYCDYYGYGYVSDLREFGQQLTDDRGPSKYPIGQVFALNHLVKPAKWWWKYTRKTEGRTISVIVFARNVYRLVGDMTNFVVYSKDFRINCGAGIGIYPLVKGKSSK
jgi:hypothetical protein